MTKKDCILNRTATELPEPPTGRQHGITQAIGDCYAGLGRMHRTMQKCNLGNWGGHLNTNGTLTQTTAIQNKPQACPSTNYRLGNTTNDPAPAGLYTYRTKVTTMQCRHRSTYTFLACKSVPDPPVAACAAMNGKTDRRSRCRAGNRL